MSDTEIRNMEQFAALTGLSRPTVSKYFNHPESVRPKTRARIEAAIERYDYRPNIFAMNQNRKLTKNIGIVVPYLADPVFAEIARKTEQRCIDSGFRPHLFSAHGDPNLELDILDGLRLLKPAGVLMAPLGRLSNRDALAKFCDDIPTVLFDSNIEDMGRAFFGSNNPQFLALIVQYLCRTGEAPCFFEMIHPANPNANKRRQGYIAAMEAIGKTPQVISVPGEGWAFEHIGHQGGLDVLSRDSFHTNTVLCSNDRLAIGFLTACFEKGVRVGRAEGCDIRVAGQDDHPFSRYTCPPLTTIAQDFDAVSRRAVLKLFNIINEEDTAIERETVLFDGHLIMRDSA